MSRQTDKDNKPTLAHNSGTSPTEGRPEDPGKRKLLVGSLGAAPLLFTLSSRPALAASCSMSGWHSANLSKPDDHCMGVGFSPGYWKNQGAGRNSNERWPQSQAGQAEWYCSGISNDGCTATEFGEVFGSNEYGDLSMLGVMLDHPNSAGNHAVAAVLNAARFGAAAYGMSELEVVDLYMEYVLGNVSREDIRAFFEHTWRNN